MEQLLERAATLTLRAPELALVLGERAAALAESAGSNELWVRAECAVVGARVRLGVRAATVGRAVAALRAAEDVGQVTMAAQLRTDLAVCARSVGAPLVGLAALRPALASGGLHHARRAAALCHLVGCLGRLGRKAELDRTFQEADRLCLADDSMDRDSRLLARALLRVGISAHRRRHGDLIGAADAARTGIGFVDDLGDPAADGGLVRPRLVLELVCALLDRGDTELALELAGPVLAGPRRAASVAPAGWLGLAVATRIYLPDGAAEAATRLLREVVHGTERHGLHALTSRLWFELAHVEEQLGRAHDAIECLHRSRAAEHVHARSRRQAFALLTGEFGAGDQSAIDLDDLLTAPASWAAAPATVASPPETRRVEPSLRVASEPLPATTVTPVASSGTSEQAAPARSATVPTAPVAPVAGTPFVAAEPGRQAEPARAYSTGRDDWAGASGHRSEARSGGTQGYETRDTSDASDMPDTAQSRHRDAASRREVARTRHDSEHGSVAARSVLDRLGIAPGGAGGRRRAAEGDDRTATGGSAGPGRQVAKQPDTDPPALPSEVREVPELPALPALPELPSLSPAPHGSEGTLSTGAERSEDPALEPLPSFPEPDTNDWLPRLRLPPSLAPMDDLDSTYPTYSQPSTSQGDTGSGLGSGFGETGSFTSTASPFGESTEPAPFERSYDGTSYEPSYDRGYESELREEEPPPGAGLAELLTRALAEHQAGTSSAAALVKRLGATQDEAGSSRRVNGRHRDDE